MFALAAAVMLTGAASASATPFDEGEKLYRFNRPAEAIPLLEKAVADGGTDERAWMYLGNCYELLDPPKLDEASSAFRRGLAQSSRLKPLFYYDLGHVFFLPGKNAFAVEMLNQAIGLDAAFSPAYLDRANSRLAVKDYGGAGEDYRRYLELEPASAQRATIEALLAKLDAGIAEAERAAAVAEAKKQADEAARKELLDKMAASLKAAADETTSLSAGAGDVQGYGDELKLDE
jgi:hypothetical protein